MRHISRALCVMIAAAALVGAVACTQQAGREINVKSATFTALHSDATRAASSPDIARLEAAYQAAGPEDDDLGTTAPGRIDAVLDSGESLVILGGGQHFQSVDLGGRQFNLNGDKLHALLAEIAAMGDTK